MYRNLRKKKSSPEIVLKTVNPLVQKKPLQKQSMLQVYMVVPQDTGYVPYGGLYEFEWLIIMSLAVYYNIISRWMLNYIILRFL